MVKSDSIRRPEPRTPSHRVGVAAQRWHWPGESHKRFALLFFDRFDPSGHVLSSLLVIGDFENRASLAGQSLNALFSAEDLRLVRVCENHFSATGSSYRQRFGSRIYLGEFAL